MKKILSLFLITAFCLPFLSACAVIRLAPPENVYIVDAMTKCTLGTKPPQTGKNTLTASLAQNEYENMQFILYFDYDVTNVSVQVSDLVNKAGDILELSGFYREHYIPVTPDALIPLMYDDLNTFDIKAEAGQGIMLTVKSAQTQPAGTYTGTVTVTFDGGERTIPVSVEVWDFAIPTKPSMQTSFELWFFTVWELMNYNNATENVDYYDIYRQYYWALADYRLCANTIPEPYNSPEEFAQKVEEYMATGRVPNYRIPMAQNNTDENGELLQIYKDYIDALDARGLLDYGLTYTYDEPHTTVYDDIERSFSAVHNYNPKVRQLLTSSPRRSLYGTVDIWCGLYCMENTYEQTNEERTDAGDEVWWYGCLDPKDPFPNYHIETKNPLSPRLLSWMQRDWGITGNLYWASAISTKNFNGWGAHRDIWTENSVFYPVPGDGFLLYAGTKNDGVINRNIPIPTMRIETIRAGMEDYEYLCLMEQKVASILERYQITDTTVDEVMDTYYAPLYTSQGNMCNDPELVQSVRRSLAQDIMAPEDELVAVFAALSEENANMREVRVYAPSGSSVIIDGQVAEETQPNVYSRVFPMKNNEQKQIRVKVNGTTYTKHLKSIPEYEYKEIACALQKQAILELGVADKSNYAQIRNNYLENTFDYGMESDGILSIIGDGSLLPMIQNSIRLDYYNTFPLVVTNESLGFDKIGQRLTLYVPQGATVQVQGQDTQFVKNDANYSCYQYDLLLDGENRYPIEITVTADGKTETFSRIIYQQYSAGQYLTKDQEFDVSFQDGKAVLPAESLTTDNLRGYTHLRFDVTNTTSHRIKLPQVTTTTTRGSNTQSFLYALLKPGDTVTVTVPILRTLTAAPVQSITLEYIDEYESLIPNGFTISNFCALKMPDYSPISSDYILLY